MGKTRAIKDKRYEERHKEERKAKCMVWGTSILREKAEKINEFLKRYGYTKGRAYTSGLRRIISPTRHRLCKVKGRIR